MGHCKIIFLSEKATDVVSQVRLEVAGNCLSLSDGGIPLSAILIGTTSELPSLCSTLFERPAEKLCMLVLKSLV